MMDYSFPKDCEPKLHKLSPIEYDEMVPDDHVRDYVGQSSREDYIRIGLGVRDALVREGLSPDHAVLDIGCGSGRIAVSLVDFLSEKGTYEGFDIVPRGIKWCREMITTKYPNFRFQCVELFNDAYAGSMTAYSYKDDDGKSIQLNEATDASRFIFPYPDKQFDFVFATSLFTHLHWNEMENYLSEIFRVMKDPGTCLATFFILENVGDDSVLKFNHPFGEGYAHNPDSPLDAIAFKEDYLKRTIAKKGFAISSIAYGSWRGNGYTGGPQDHIVFKKQGDA